MLDVDTTRARAQRYLNRQATGLRDVAAKLDLDAVEAAVERLAVAHKVLVCGVGKSWHVGAKVAATFNSTGTTAVNLHATEAMHGDLGAAQEGDVALVLSFSGESEEIRHLAAALQRAAIPVVAITRCPRSALGQVAEIVLAVPVSEEACPFNLAPTCSSLATLAVGDLLAILAAEERGFDRERYHALHPAGAIGRSLTPLREVMRVGDRVARVPPSARVRDALEAMTRARGGAGVIVHEDGQVAGIVTDGDVRRHILGDGGLDVPVSELMTAKPVRLHADQRVEDAWRLFQETEIDDLVVVEADGTLAGLVDLQDLPKLKSL